MSEFVHENELTREFFMHPVSCEGEETFPGRVSGKFRHYIKDKQDFHLYEHGKPLLTFL